MKVCGVDSEKIGDAEVERQNELVARHVAGLKHLFRGQRVRFVSLVEGNMSWMVANQICLLLQAEAAPFPVAHGCKDEARKVLGVSTTEEVKINMVNTARNMMARDRLAIRSDLVVAGSRKGLVGDARRASAIRALGEQLKTLQQKVKGARDIFGRAKAKISGKIGAANDDVAIAFLFGVHWATAHRSAGRLPLRAV
jgi:hypothetical protein